MSYRSDDAADAYADFGLEATYTPPTGSAITGIKAICRRNRAIGSDGDGVRLVVPGDSISMLVADVAEPVAGATIAVTEDDGSTTSYRVDEIVDGGDWENVMAVTKL